MNPTRALMLLLFTGSFASAACIVEKIDTDNEGGSGGTTATTGGGGTAEGGGNEGGNAQGGAGTGGMAEGGGGEGGSAPTCIDTCDAMYPNGVADFSAYSSCVTCSACYDICDGGAGDVCASGAEDAANCSATAQDCESCINGTCAADVDGNGQTSGVCGAELGDFLNNADALSLNDCYNACP